MPVVTVRSITLAFSPSDMGAKSYSSNVYPESERTRWMMPVPGTYSIVVGASDDSQAPTAPTRTPG